MMHSYNFTIKRLLNSESVPKLNLERIEKIMQKLNNPQNDYLIFHVAGTNGKGSTCAFLESILRIAGYRVGLYTSPHLSSIRERIQINRELISIKDFVNLERKISPNGTFFERITAMAFLYFSECNVDVAVVEVGLGGNLDATNIVNPIVTGISRIALDHQNILGNSIEKIALDKAGIIKPGIPAVWSNQSKEVEEILLKIAGCKIDVDIDLHNIYIDKLGLLGDFQLENASLAIKMIKASNFKIDQKHINIGLSMTKWPCRFELILPNVIIDGAHNPLGIEVLVKALNHAKFKPSFIWIGLTSGHDSLHMAQMLYQAFPEATVFVGQSSSKRAIPRKEVKNIMQRVGFLNVVEIFEKDVKTKLCNNERNLITGSLYWCGLIRSIVLNQKLERHKTFY